MPLTLVTGPANAAKAGEVLGGLRDRLAEEPILVVPAAQDVEHNQRELAERGAVFGAQVVAFDWLFGLVAERAGYGERIASELQRELIVERAVAGAPLRVLARSAGHEGFAKAALEFIKELEAARVDPDRLERALLRWASAGGSRAYAEEIAAIYRGYRDGLEAAGLADEELFGWRALDALRRDPQAWGRSPVFVYGFDDFSPLQLDALETLAKHSGVRVTVSLPFEPGRLAFKAVAEVHTALAGLADDHVALEAVSDHYDDDSRAALHHLERSLFEDEPPPAEPAGEAVTQHAAGGVRAEVELVGAEVLRLLRGRARRRATWRSSSASRSATPPSWSRSSRPTASPSRSPATCRSSTRASAAACWRLLRCATPRRPRRRRTSSPICGRRASCASRGARTGVEAEVRRRGARTAAEAREVWEDLNPKFELSEIDRLREARGTRQLLEHLDAELQRLFAAPHRRQAPVLGGSRARGSARVPGRRTTRCASSTRWPIRSTAAGSTTLLAELPSASGRRRSPTASRWRAPRRSGLGASRRSSSAGSRRASSPAVPRPSPSSPTTTAVRWRVRETSCCGSARTSSTASATSSTSAPRAPSGCSC